MQEGDCQYFKRVDKRSVSERVEIASVDAGRRHADAELAAALDVPVGERRTSRRSPRSTGPIIRWAGIESVALQGGTNPGYDGQMAGGIDISNAAYCWVKDVQTDGTIGGMHVSLTGTYRSVVRDSYFHHSANYGFGADCYGIVLRCGAADNLVENNIARYMNKPILFNVSGGGNVIGYNYADNSWATPAAWQEVNIDTHCSFPHMELMEGNYAPHMGATITHGNAGYLTYFRNYASSQFAPPAVYGVDRRADREHHRAAVRRRGHRHDRRRQRARERGGDRSRHGAGEHDRTSAPAPTARRSSSSATTPTTTAPAWPTSPTRACGGTATTTRSRAGVVWNPSIAARTLPASLYLSAKPAWWPAGSAWPWAGSDLTPMVGTLPAKARSDAIGP